MEDYYEYLDSNGVTTLYKLIKDDTVALIDSYSVTLNGITTNLDNHVNNTDIHTPIVTIEGMIDTRISGLVNSAPETLDTLKELSDALGNDPNFATTVANQIGTKASKDDVYTKGEADTLLEDKANSVHNHVVSDITDFPTIPTKTSQLINDSGFLTSSNGLITSVSWGDITNKPNFSTVATSGSYTDLSNTPTIPTKVSQLENDMGFGTGGGSTDITISWTNITDKPTIPTKTSDLTNDSGFVIDSNVVHKTGNEAISGAKIFLNDIFRKNTSVDLTVTPTGYTNTNIIFADKNDKTIAHFEFVQRPSGVNDVGIFAWDKNGNAHGIHINTNNEVIPLMSSSESYSLGSATYKWGKVYSNDVVHTSGAETINGAKTFTNDIFYKNGNLDLTVTPTSNTYANFIFRDKNNKTLGYLQYGKQTSGNGVIGIYLYDSSQALHGLQVTSNNYVVPLTNSTYQLGASDKKWLSVYATTYYGNLVGGLTLNQATLKMTVKDSNSETTRTNDVILANSSNTSYGINVAFGGSGNTVVGAGESYTAQLNELAGNSQENLYLTADNNIYIKVGANTFANAKTITISSSAELSGLAKVTATSFVGALTGNVTGNCSGSSSSCTGNAATATSANSATYATTQATSDNSTKIATTAWVRTYVNSVVGSGSVGASISAYYSNATTKTAEGSVTGNSGVYPADYSDYINIAPTVGTIYTGSQLFSSFTPTASGTIQKVTPSGSPIYQTSAKATATFSGAFSASAKYLCTTANAVKFRAYVAQGTPSTMGAASVVDQSSSKSIFLRVQ